MQLRLGLCLWHVGPGKNLEVRDRGGALGLYLHVGRTQGDAKRRLFSWPKMLDIAFCTVRSARTLAHVFHCSHQTIRRVQCSVAWAYLQTQILFYGRILFSIAQRKPLFAISDVMWDETSERLNYSDIGQIIIPGATVSSTSHIMQARFAFCWGYAGAQPSDWTSCYFEVVSIPMVVPSPSAANLWAAFKKHSNIEPLMAFRHGLMSSATYALEFKECDGASGNDKLIAHWVKSQSEPKLSNQTILCRNHRNQLGVVHATSVISEHSGDSSRMLADMYAVCLFLKTGAHFVRLVVACEAVVEETFDMKAGWPPEHVVARNRQLEAYLLQNYPFGRDMGKTNKQGTGRSALVRYQKDLAAFFDVFNGERFGEYYDCGTCARMPSEIKRAMVNGLRSVLLRSQPTPPNEEKWTKIGPAFDFFITSDAYGILPVLARVAYSRMTFCDAQGLPPSGLIVASDQTVTRDTH